MNKIILASSSIYRKILLEKTGLAFSIKKPLYDEENVKQQALAQKKSPIEIAEILSKGKAAAVYDQLPPRSDVLVIAGDQLVHFKNEIVGKSGDFENAKIQLKKMINETHLLITAVTLQGENFIRHFNHVTTLKMKNLNDQEIEAYINLDQPYDCAGSYKIENSGLILFEKIECSDFTAIQGLPLIWTTNQLKELGYEFFKK